MRRSYFIGGSLALFFGLSCATGIGGSARAEPAPLVGDETFEGVFSCAAPDAATSDSFHCRSDINPSLARFDFFLVGHADKATGIRVLDRIEVTRSGETVPFQTISPVNSSVPDSVANYGFEAIDLNFDGYLDLRVISFLPAGPNVPYENWLWSVARGRFVANPALDKITSPQFDADAQEITSHWRSSAAAYGTDVYAYDGNTPVLIHRETDTYDAAGSCRRVYYDQIDDELRKNGTGPCTAAE
ncbi:MAG: hypothetical protein WA138_16495 [Parvibaculum sp.]